MEVAEVTKVQLAKSTHERLKKARRIFAFKENKELTLDDTLNRLIDTVENLSPDFRELMKGEPA